MAPEQTRRIPGPVRALLAANLVSSLGGGLTLPFLLIYLHQVRHIGLGLTGLLIGAASVASVPAGPVTGSLVDRLGPRLVTSGALVVAAAGAFALILVRGPLSALPALVLFGVGNGSLWPAWTALFAVMVHDEQLRPRVFARSFQLLNLGLGAGAVIAGVVVRVGQPATFELIYAIDGITFFAVVAALYLQPKSAFVRPATAAHHLQARGGYREVLADRRFRRYLLGALLLAFAGYASVDAGLVGYATTVVLVHPDVIAWAFGANTGLIVVCQPLALRLTARMRRSHALSFCAALFALSWGVLLLAGAFPRSVLGAGLVVAMFGVFAIGEVALSPVGGPLVTLLARPALQGRYNALAASAYSLAGVVGPAIAGTMLAARLGDAYLGLLIGLAAAAGAAFQWMRPLLGDRLDNVAPGGRPHLEPATVPAERSRAS